MSGHSKWSQIKHKKAATDQKRGQVFSKFASKITIAARHGSDPSSNYRLQSAIEEAQAANVPKENIERAIKRAEEKDTTNVEEVMIQAVGPGGIAIVIEAITDNRNRTISKIKHLLAGHEFKMVPEGSLNWMFTPHLSGTNATHQAESQSQKGAGFQQNWTPFSPLEVDRSIQEKISRLLETLSGNEDIENVYTNLAETSQ